MNKLLWTCIFIILYSNNLLCAKTKIECGYKQCPHTREGTLNVHLIPHSHMDAGWVKTFDQYYYGTKTSISSANVQLIYHSVISELLHDKRRKFTLSETAYFWRWWKEQRPATRATFRSLVQEGRVEFAGGGWTHSDSATVTYLQILDLFTWGLRKLNDTLGPCGKPKAAWQIDSYGHTREEASLLAQMGFDGLFLGRVDFKEREAMMEEDRMEFMWRGSDVLGKMSDIMTHAMFNLYNAPNGFCFDWLCGDEPVIDDADSPAYNADARVNEFISQIEKQAKYYDHDNILVTMGGDFTYQNAANWFMNIDKLINHVNSHPANLSDINIFYSTPSCYLKAIYLYGRRDKAVYTEKSDYLPYGSDASTYWTGFYTSRPSLKYFTKRAHVFLQVVKQLSVIARSGDSYELHLLRHAVSLILHHDGITGTSQQHVANDFLKTLSEAVDVCTKKVSNLISYLTPTWGGSRRSKNSQQFVLCHQLNISQCRFVESQESVLLLVYNPLTVKAYHYVRLPSIALHYSIRDYNDEEVEYQINPLPPAIVNLPGRSSSTVQELWFEAENIPPLGFSSYYLTPLRDQLEENNYKKNAQNAGEADSTTVPYISNEYLRVSIDKTTGLLESIQHVDGVKVQVSQNFYFYSQGRQQMQSGAYSFRPDQMRPVPVTERVQYSIIRGALVKEIRQRFCEWISQVVRLYRGEEMVEIEWVVGPVPIGSDLGKEVVSILKTNISNGGEFFTDSNGRQMMKRTCWNETAIQQQKKPVPACYFPVTSRICIRSLNSSAAMCVLTDRTQGGTSYDDGEIELMVHRRLLTDDGFGLEEPLNEEAHGVGLVVKGTHRIMFGNFKHDDNLNLSEMAAQAARRWEMEPWLFLTSGDKVSRRKWQNIRNKRYSALRLHGLPAYIHILTLEPWKAGSVLLRLENILEASKGRFRGQESIEESKSHITVDLRKIFLQHKIKLVRETTLAANQWLEDARQMDWSTRYVYSGGDDGILPEDMPDDENRSVKRDAERQDSGPYSDEETEYPKKYVGRRIAQRIRPKLKQVKTYNYERRRRSVNDSVNINDNIINDTVQDFKLELKINDPIETTRGVSNMATTERYKNTTIKNSQKQPKLSRKTPKLSFWNKPKEHQSTRVPHWDVEEEMGSSEEDFSANLRKRSSNKKNRSSKKPKEEIVIDDSDDGITKSMYEMYYKPLPRNPYKKKKQQGIVRRKKPKRSEDSDEPTEKPAERKVRSERQDISKRQGRSERQDMSERQGRSERQDMSERQGRSERQDMSERQGRSERQDISERQGRSERPDRMERQNRIERQDRTERQDRNERVERSRRNRNGIKKKRINADIPFFMTDRRNNRRVAEVQKEKTEVAEVEDDTPLNGTERSREDNTSPKTLKRRRAEPLTVMTTKRDTDDDEPDDDDDDEEEEDEYEDSWRKHRVRRNKRTLPKDEEVEANNASEQDSSEPEHIVTLRPTQIRTFIIWFEPAKKSYVVI